MSFGWYDRTFTTHSHTTFTPTAALPPAHTHHPHPTPHTCSHPAYLTLHSSTPYTFCSMPTHTSWPTPPHRQPPHTWFVRLHAAPHTLHTHTATTGLHIVCYHPPLPAHTHHTTHYLPVWDTHSSGSMKKDRMFWPTHLPSCLTFPDATFTHTHTHYHSCAAPLPTRTPAAAPPLQVYPVGGGTIHAGISRRAFLPHVVVVTLSCASAPPYLVLPRLLGIVASQFVAWQHLFTPWPRENAYLTPTTVRAPAACMHARLPTRFWFPLPSLTHTAAGEKRARASRYTTLPAHTTDHTVQAAHD